MFFDLFLNSLAPYQADIEVLTCPLSMGENYLAAHGFDFQLVNGDARGVWLDRIEQAKRADKAFDFYTEAEDTIDCAKKIVAAGVDILIFVGGDGTARDVCVALGRHIDGGGHSRKLLKSPRNNLFSIRNNSDYQIPKIV